MIMWQAGIIMPTADGGYDVVLSLAQAQFFNKNATKAIAVHITQKRVQPSQAHLPGTSGYALCVYDNAVRCFWAPTTS